MKSPDDKIDADGPVFSDLIQRYLMGALEPGETDHLEQAMLASPELRERYLRAVRMDVAIHEHALTPDVVAPSAVRFRPWMRVATLAAAIAVAAGFWNLRSKAPDLNASRQAAPPLTIATLVDSRDCTWRKGSVAAAVDDRLAPCRIELESGVALIEFDGGARLALKGPGGLELIDAKSARLHHGSATVRCEEGAYTFGLHTPNSTVIDIGTEFGVMVEPDGTSEVHVLDGEVEVADAATTEQPSTLFLDAGKTLIQASNGSNRMVDGTVRNWVRDYSTLADREAEDLPPQIIARDPFPEQLDQPNLFAQGSGWKGPWRRSTKSASGVFQIAPMAPAMRRDGTWGTGLMIGKWVEGRRTLQDPIEPNTRQTIYLGFSIHRVNPSQRDEQGVLGQATVMLRSSHDPTALLGMALSGRNHWVVLENGGWERSESPVSGRGPYFVVAKIELNPWTGNKVSMIGFKDFKNIPPEEPETWELVSKRKLAKISVPLNVVALQAHRSPFKFGEITLGNSWQAVVDPASAGK